MRHHLESRKDAPVDQRILNLIELPKLLRRGYTPQMIAERFGVSSIKVQSDIQVVLQELRVARDKDTEALVIAKLEEIAEVKREAWKMWTASKKPLKKRILERPIKANIECVICSGVGRNQRGAPCSACNGTGSRGKKGKKISESKDVRGNPEYLKLVLKCIETECKLMALFPLKGMAIGFSSSTGLDWDMLAKGIPVTGNIDDEIEAEIERAVMQVGIKKAEEVEGGSK